MSPGQDLDSEVTRQLKYEVACSVLQPVVLTTVSKSTNHPGYVAVDVQL